MNDRLNFFIEAHIADLHFGAFDPNRQYQLLKEQFISKLYELPILDIVSINGDVFHHKFMANSDAVSVACYFVSDLIELCHQKDATLIITSGTYSHDADQIKLFYPIAAQAMTRGVDIRIAEEVKFEYIKGKRVLLIPELYGKGQEYYKSFLYDDRYDACYMHGTYAGSIFGKDIPNLDAEREPVFCIRDFALCTGPIISGHVHTPGCFDKHFYYCGSPYRWQFGEEEDKGFIIMMQDISNHTYAVHYEPIISDKYITMNLDSMINEDPQKIITYINQVVKEENIQYIRLVFTSIDEKNLLMLNEYYRNNRNVSFLNKSKNENVMKDMKEVEDKYGQYQYLFDKNMTPEEKLVTYINQTKGSTFITVAGLTEILKKI